MVELIDGFGVDAPECIHGLTTTTCSYCLGKLRAAPYRQALQNMKLIAEESVEPSVPDCELCASRGPCKGNRVFVRLPRPPRNAWGKGIPPYPPSFAGPVVAAPKIYKATHRTPSGKMACDRCHDDGRPPEKVTQRDRSVLTAQRIFGI